MLDPPSALVSPRMLLRLAAHRVREALGLGQA